MSIIVHCARRKIDIGGLVYDCRIGREGYIAAARGCEGDGKTPLGTYPVRFGLYRPDRLPKPPCALPFRALRRDDGWCDDPKDPAYNRFVRTPYPASHETLWREDGVYDVILVLGHNDTPPAPGLGSAIFLHIAHIDERTTLGCISVAPETMIQLFRVLRPGIAAELREH